MANAARSTSPEMPEGSRGVNKTNRHGSGSSNRVIKGEIASGSRLPASTNKPPCWNP